MHPDAAADAELAGRLSKADLATAQLNAGDAPGADAAARRAFALQRANGRVAEVLARVIQASRTDPEESEVLLAKAGRLSNPAELALR